MARRSQSLFWNCDPLMSEYDFPQLMNLPNRSDHRLQPPKLLRYIDLFCGIGGFRVAIQQAAPECGFVPACVFSSDIDQECQKAYEAKFPAILTGDIRAVEANSIPDHDLLLGGFPCEPFSIIGQMKGFEDTRGTLFFEIARILAAKRPKAFVLENVKRLFGHNGGKTLARIMETLRQLGYQASFRALNALHFGLPQKRERVFIVGFLQPRILNGRLAVFQ